MIKNKKYLIFIQLLKFNSAQIIFNSNSIVLIKKGYVGSIFLVIDYNANFTCSKEITKKKLLFKKQYLAQKVRSAYIIFIYQLKIFFNLFWVVQIVEFLPMILHY